MRSWTARCGRAHGPTCAAAGCRGWCSACSPGSPSGWPVPASPVPAVSAPAMSSYMTVSRHPRRGRAGEQRGVRRGRARRGRQAARGRGDDTVHGAVLPRGHVARRHGARCSCRLVRSGRSWGTAPSRAGCRIPTEPTRSSSTRYSASSSISRSATPSRSRNGRRWTTEPIARTRSAGRQRTVRGDAAGGRDRQRRRRRARLAAISGVLRALSRNSSPGRSTSSCTCAAASTTSPHSEPMSRRSWAVR